jgi:putative nucleotidyltransferase with HDIG domain
MALLIIALTLLAIITSASIYVVKKKNLENEIRRAYRTSILSNEIRTDYQPITPIIFKNVNSYLKNDSKNVDPLPNIFIRKSSDSIWEGRYVPFTLDKLSENLEIDLKSRINEIPPLPNLAHRLISTISDITVPTKTITELVSGDPVLAGKLIQLVNSSFYGVSKEVTSVGRAIILLGYNTVKSFVIQINLSKVMPKIKEDILSMDKFWLHSLSSSTIAHHIASQIPELNPGTVSTIALLHDIGKLAMALWKPEEMRKYQLELNESSSALPIMIEEKIFGLHHALIGFLLAMNWKLPIDLCKIILYHHHPVFVDPDIIPNDLVKSVTIVHFSNQLSKLCNLGVDNDTVIGTRQGYFQLIGKEPPIENFIGQKVIKEIQKIMDFIKPTSNVKI